MKVLTIYRGIYIYSDKFEIMYSIDKSYGIEPSMFIYELMSKIDKLKK